MQTEDKHTTLTSMQIESLLHLVEAWEFLLTMEIQKWKAIASSLQHGSIPVEAHRRGVKEIWEQATRVVADHITQVEKAKQMQEYL